MTIHDPHHLPTNPLEGAQREMRVAYLGGGPGMLVSAFMWLAAGVTTAMHSGRMGMWVLLACGMFIAPLSLLLTRVLGRPARHAATNPLGRLVMETTVWMILAMLICVVLGLVRADLFFPAMLLVIGGRYLTFATIYGDRIYWLVGMLLAIAAWALAAGGAGQAIGAFAGGAIELVFAVVITARSRAAAAG